ALARALGGGAAAQRAPAAPVEPGPRGLRAHPRARPVPAGPPAARDRASMVRFGADLGRAARAFQRFSFQAVDPAPLGVLRWAFGLYLCFYYLDLFSFLHLFHFPPGLVTERQLAEAPFWVVF